MQINSSLNSVPQSTSFGKKYPFGDIMSIMSACYAGNTKSVNKTCASIVGKEVGDIVSQRANFNKARQLLVTKRSDLCPTAAKFANAIDAENSNHYAITAKRMKEIVNAEAKDFGSKSIDINV